MLRRAGSRDRPGAQPKLRTGDSSVPFGSMGSSPPPPPPSYPPVPPPPPPQPPPPGPPPRRATLRWGLGDAVLAFVLAIVGAIVVTQIVIGVTGTKQLPGGGYPETAAIIGATVAGQYGAWFLWMLLVSKRKGIGTLRADFGFVVDLARDWVTIAIGFGLEIAAGIALYPITHLVKKTPQQVVHDLDTAHGPKLTILVVTAIVVAPAVEELFFRGLLLRALQRRVSAPLAVAIAALAFGLTHLLFDFGSGAVLPALVFLGLVSGSLAVRSGNLSRSILLHAGFNLVAVLAVLTNH